MTLPHWLAALQALLPPGRALTREPTAKLTQLLEAIAGMFLDAQLRLEALLVEADPRRAVDLLPDWERTLGLPDTCTANLQLSTADRQRLAFARLVEEGGQSRAYFIALAASYGEPGCTITDGFRRANCNGNCNDTLYGEGDVFVWIVNIPRPINQVQAANCAGNCNDALASYTVSLAECPITERRPAHTTVLFKYAP